MRFDLRLWNALFRQGKVIFRKRKTELETTHDADFDAFLRDKRPEQYRLRNIILDQYQTHLHEQGIIDTNDYEGILGLLHDLASGRGLPSTPGYSLKEELSKNKLYTDQKDLRNEDSIVMEFFSLHFPVHLKELIPVDKLQEAHSKNQMEKVNLYRLYLDHLVPEDLLLLRIRERIFKLIDPNCKDPIYVFVGKPTSREIHLHHQKTIDKLVAAYRDQSFVEAIIIGGSVAKGCARGDSDVDFMMLVQDEEYIKREAVNDLFINRTDLCDYPKGYVDGKIISWDYLKLVAEKGNEPTRAAFDGAFPAFNKDAKLLDLLHRIQRYPEEGREERMRSFYSMAFIQHWLMGEADRHDNLYTKTRAASQLTLFASRLILAHNRILFPYHKWLISYLDKCPDKPEHFKEQIEQLLLHPNMENAHTLFNNLKEFQDWGVTDLEAFTWFLTDVEWSWMRDQTPLEDL